MLFVSNSENETKEIAYKIGKEAKKGQIYCLVGDLGVGKTVFTKGFALGIGINDHITSPTFTIVNTYNSNPINLHHFDVYRIQYIEEMEEIGYEEYFYSDDICFIEWANYIEEIIPSDAIWIYIEKDLSKGEDYRKITMEKVDK